MKNRSYYQSMENAELIHLTRGYYPTEDFAALAGVLADRLEVEEEERSAELSVGEYAILRKKG